MRILGGTLAVAFVLLVAGAQPAAGIFTENTIGCAGSADITDGDTTVHVDANDASAVIPPQGSAAWEGSVETITHNHSGKVELKIGPGAVPLGSWGPSENADDEASASGVKELPEALGDVPPGSYDVRGHHEGDEGRCAGHMKIEIDGSPLSNPFVLVSLALTAIFGVALFASLRAAPSKSGVR